MRTAVAVPAGLGLIALAFGVAFSTPGDAQVEASFAVTGGLGEQIVSEHLVATVDEVGLVREVEVGFWRGTTAGIWLLIDATIDARVERTTVDVEVYVDGVRYSGTDRAGSATIDAGVVDAGFPLTGSALVELPADVTELPGARTAVLRIGTGGDQRLDSVIELVIDLTALEVRDSAERESVRDGVS